MGDIYSNNHLILIILISNYLFDIYKKHIFTPNLQSFQGFPKFVFLVKEQRIRSSIGFFVYLWARSFITEVVINVKIKAFKEI